MMDKRFIEESFPVKEVSEESANEKKIFRGNIPTFHVWWARRPLASSRATAYAALIPAAKNKEDYEKKRKFIVDLSKWDNILNQKLIESANKDIMESSNGKTPKVLDPFSGGGAIPLEALRLGCETYANDYNPVAVLIEKCILEYPQKYGKKISVDIKKYGDWVLEESRKELAKYYAKINVNKKNYFGDSEEGSIPIGYIWARTVKCQNPNCEAEIPLLKQLWLANKPGRKIALFPEIEKNQIKFKIVGTGYEKIPNGFDPSIGLVKRAKAECKVCGTVIDAESVRKQFIDGKSFHKLIVVVYSKPGTTGKKYQIPSQTELEVIQESEEYLTKKVHILEEKWGIEPVPKEPLKRVPVSFGVINVWFYGMNTWGSLFNGRQKLAIITFIDNIRKVYSKMLENKHSEEYAKVICTYLGTILSKSTNFNSSLSMWASNRECSIGAFSRNALQMVWDYFEINPFSGLMGSWKSLSNWSLESLNTCYSTKK